MAQTGKLKDRDLIIIITAFIAIIGFIFILKYWDLTPKGLKLTKKGCLKEVNKQYVSPSKGSETFYKIDRIENDTYHMRVFRNGNWTFIAPKPTSYFKEGDIFKFENTACPDVISFDSTKKETQYQEFQFAPKKK